MLQVIDTIMYIFDSNNDGTLDLEEFVTVLKRRKERGLSGDRGIPLLFVFCSISYHFTDTGIFRKVERIWKCVKAA